MTRRWLGVAALGSALFAGVGIAGAAVPGEVLGLTIDGDVLSWDPAPGATTYNVYRGYLQDLARGSNGSTLEGEVASLSRVDTMTPVVGEGFFYLVTAANAEGEGTMGPGAGDVARPNATPWPGLAVAGRWEGPLNWPCEAVHLAILHEPGDPAGWKMLTWEGRPQPSATFLWDPVNDLHTEYDTDDSVFCAGHSFLPDGRLLATGGDVEAPSGWGVNTTWTFDPANPGWVRGPDMLDGRYYPTNVAMGDGRTAVFGGNAEGLANQYVEAFAPGPESMQLLGSTYPQITEYPQMFLLNDGKIFQAGPINYNHTYDPVADHWQYVDMSAFGFRTAGTAVLLPNSQKVLITGGFAVHPNSTETAEIIDMAAATPAWRSTDSMHFRRMNLNSTILPTGEVLVTGGGYDDIVPVYPSEIFDPATESWTVAATMHSFRRYHSTAALLPDGRVITAGSDYNYTVEYYSPGYLFRGPRPVISTADAVATYGGTIVVTTPDAASIASVVMLRPAAVTHAFNQDQRYVQMPFLRSGNDLTVSVTGNPNEAPPGYYMLFVLNGDGVPSEARFVHLQ